MSETNPEQAEQQTDAQGDPAAAGDKPLGENGEKALKAEREARAAADKKASELQKQLDDIAAANLSDLEKAQKAAKEAQDALPGAVATAFKEAAVSFGGISQEDADLFLTGTDVETLSKQVAALAARTSAGTQPGPRPDLSQGSKGGTSSGTPEQDFANFLGRQLAG